MYTIFSQQIFACGAEIFFRPNNLPRLSTHHHLCILFRPSFCQALFRTFLKFCSHESVGDPSRFFFSVCPCVRPCETLALSHFYGLNSLSHAPQVLLSNFSLPTTKLSKCHNFLHLHFFQQSHGITICGATTGQNHGFFACFSLVFLLPVELKV